MKKYNKPGNLRRNFVSPIPFQGCHSEKNTACITPLPALNVKVNEQVLEGAKLPTTYENIIKKETVKNISLVDTNGKEYRPVNLKRDFMSPIPFQSSLSVATTPSITPGIALFNNGNKKDVEVAKLLNFSRNNTKKDNVTNTYCTKIM